MGIESLKVSAVRSALRSGNVTNVKMEYKGKQSYAKLNLKNGKNIVIPLSFNETTQLYNVLGPSKAKVNEIMRGIKNREKNQHTEYILNRTKKPNETFNMYRARKGYLLPSDPGHRKLIKNTFTNMRKVMGPVKQPKINTYNPYVIGITHPSRRIYEALSRGELSNYINRLESEFMKINYLHASKQKREKIIRALNNSRVNNKTAINKAMNIYYTPSRGTKKNIFSF